MILACLSDEHELDDCQVEDNIKAILINNIRRRLTPQAVKCRAGMIFLILILKFSMFFLLIIRC